jgi:hypothetical protein
VSEQAERWHGREAMASSNGVDLKPATAYEAVTRQMVEDLARELVDIKGRLNGLLFMVAGAIVVDLALRLAGA